MARGRQEDRGVWRYDAMGRIDYSIASNVRRGSVAATIAFPESGIAAETRLRLRAPNDMRLKSVTVNGKRWARFDAASEVIVIPANTAGRVDIVARY